MESPEMSLAAPTALKGSHVSRVACVATVAQARYRLREIERDASRCAAEWSGVKLSSLLNLD